MIYRKPKTGGNFTQTCNDVPRDKRLSLQARGLLWYMLSCKDDWYFSAQQLQKETGEKRTRIESALKELQENGYLKIEKVKNHGRYQVNFSVYEDSHRDKTFLKELQESEEEIPF